MKRSPACVVSEAGRRASNQDRACAENTIALGEPALLMALADGMGGMSAGDRAAEIAIDTVREFAASGFPGPGAAPAEIAARLVDLFQEANRRIWQRSDRDGCAGAMGSTLVCCLVFGHRFLVANAGDSRCYYVNDHEARPLTEDHNQVQEMVRRGVMTPEAARHSPYRNQLTNCLGEPHDVRVDLVPAPDKFGVIDEPSVLMLSSDGLHAHVTEADMLARLRTTGTVAEAGAALVALALAQGSTDNVSLVVVEMGRLRSRSVAAVDEIPPAMLRGPITVKLQVPPPRARRRTRGWQLAAAGVACVGLASGYWWYPPAVEAARAWLPTAVARYLPAAPASTSAPAPAAARMKIGSPPAGTTTGAAGRAPAGGLVPATDSPPAAFESSSSRGAAVSQPSSATGAVVSEPSTGTAATASAIAPGPPAAARAGSAPAAKAVAARPPWDAALALSRQGTALRFSWAPSAGPSPRYRVVVSRDRLFKKTPVETSPWVTRTEWTWKGEVPAGGPLYARVELRHADKTGSASRPLQVPPPQTSGGRAGVQRQAAIGNLECHGEGPR